MSPVRHARGTIGTLTVAILTGSLLTWSGAGTAAAGLATQAAPTPVTPAQAAAFLGDWTLSVTSQMGPMTYGVSVMNDGGKVGATISSDTLPKVNISDISMAGQNLILRYTFDYQGTSVKSVVTLIPRGAELGVAMSLMDGQFEMSGTGTKGKPALTAAKPPAVRRSRRWPGSPI